MESLTVDYTLQPNLNFTDANIEVPLDSTEASDVIWPTDVVSYLLNSSATEIRSGLDNEGDRLTYTTRRATKRSSQDAVPSLIFYALLATEGTTANILLVSSLLVQPALCRRGNAFLASQGLTNLFITAILFPASVVTILSGASGSQLDESSSTFLCYAQCCGALWCFLTSILNFLCIAAENFLRTRRDDSDLYGVCCRPLALTTFCVCAWVMGILGVACIAMGTTGPDPCLKKYDNMDPWTLLGPVFPLGLASFAFLGALATGRRRKENRGAREGREQAQQRGLSRTNTLAFVLYLVFWSPIVFLCTFGSARAMEHSFWHLICLGQAYACVWPLVYCVTHSSFRKAFMLLIRYCCCKAHTDAVSVARLRDKTGIPLATTGPTSLSVHIGARCSMDGSGRRARLSSILVSDSARARKTTEDFL